MLALIGSRKMDWIRCSCLWLMAGASVHESARSHDSRACASVFAARRQGGARIHEFLLHRLLVAPDLVHPCIPAAAFAIVGIADRVFLVVVLVILLCGVERRGGNDLGVDLRQLAAFQQRVAACYGDFAFGLVLPIDASAILCSDIAELPILHRKSTRL